MCAKFIDEVTPVLADQSRRKTVVDAALEWAKQLVMAQIGFVRSVVRSVGQAQRKKTQRGRRVDTVTLLDGAVVSLRRLDERDAEAVIAFFHRDPTDRERYYRFFVIRPGFLHRFARNLVENSPTNYAVGTFEAGRLIGVANYIRTNDPEVAEVAVAVAHKDHLRGVATAMLCHLGEAARRNGIRYFIADVLAENQALLDAMRDADVPYERVSSNAVLQIRVDLSDIPDGVGRSARSKTRGG